MHSLSLAVLSFALLAFLPSISYSQATQRDLRAFVEHASRNGTISLPEPVLEWHETQLKYFFDDYYEEHSSFQPMTIPLNEQITATSIRKYRSTNRQRRFWEPVLRKVENQISEMMTFVSRKDLTSEELEKKLEEKSAIISNIYQQELNRIARSYGRNGAYTESKTRIFTVDLHTSPENATISYMPAGHWSLYIFMTQQRNRKDFPKPQWTTIRQTKNVPLSGKNWFLVRWPNGIQHRELVIISSNNQITFTIP